MPPMLSLPGSAAEGAIQAQEIQQHSQHRGDAGPLLLPSPTNSLHGAQPPPPSDGPAAPQRDTIPEPYGLMSMTSSTATRCRSKEELAVLLKRVATTTTPQWKMPKRNEPSLPCALYATSGHESQTRASCASAKPLCSGVWVEKPGLRGTAMGGHVCTTLCGPHRVLTPRYRVSHPTYSGVVSKNCFLV